jgi:hypothetical protein
MKFTDPNQPIIENTPKITGTKCKVKVYLLYFCITLLPLLISLYIGYDIDWLIGIGSGLFLYLVSAIVVSKLRLSSLPRDQFERTFSSLEIAKWYVSRNHCL